MSSDWWGVPRCVSLGGWRGSGRLSLRTGSLLGVLVCSRMSRCAQVASRDRHRVQGSRPTALLSTSRTQALGRLSETSSERLPCRPAPDQMSGRTPAVGHSTRSDVQATFVQNPVTGPSARRLNGDEGAGLVAGLLLIVAMTVGAMMWLTIDVDTDLGVASTADDVAFQVARAAAGELDVVALRSVPRVVRVDPDAARARALVTAERLFAALNLSGDVHEVTVADDRVWVRVHIDGRRGPVESRVGVRAVSG